MGKRKSSSKPQGPKKREGLSTTFNCLFCNHADAVSVKIDKKSSVGDLSCKVCGQTFQTGTNYLSQPVDVYSDWVDACDSVAKEAADGTSRPATHMSREPGIPSRKSLGAVREEEGYEDDGDGFIENDEVDAEAEYAGE